MRGMGRRRGGGQAVDRPVVLREELPPEVAALVAAAGLEPSLSVPADIGPAGELSRRWLVASPQRLLVITPDGDHPRIDHDLSLSDVREVRLDNLIGSQALVVDVAGDQLELVRFTTAEARRYGKVRRRLDDFRQGKQPPAEDDEQPRRCPKCGGALPEHSRVCPRCIDKRQALLRLAQYLKPHVWKVLAVSGLVVAGSLFDLLQPQLNGLFFDRVLAPESNSTGREAGQLVAWMFTAVDRRGMLVQIVLAMLCFRLFNVGLEIVRGRLAAWLGYWVVHDIRAELFEHLQSLTMRYFDKRQTGAVMSRITQDTRAMQGFLIDGSQHLVDNLLRLVLVGLILLRENWALTLLTVVPAPLVLFLSTAFWKKLRRLYGRLWQRWELLTAGLQDSLSGVRVVKAFAGERAEIDRFNRGSAMLADAGSNANQLRATIMPALGFSIHFGSLVVWFVGGLWVVGGEMTTGQIMQFLSYLFMFYGPMQWISQLFNWFNETLAAAERVWEVLDEQPDVVEPAIPVRLDHIAGRFTFDHVTFGYEAHEPVLKDICLDVMPGEMIGLVGHSGAGKSTLINLICRFYDVDEGAIYLDGVDLRQIPSAEYRRNIGVVLQEPFLFSGTILANIAYGQPDAPVEEVIRAARAANAHDFICGFPDGYDTHVGERGQRLSGGERQRISIARAILHNPRVLILDEATASVDTETERQIQEALTRLIEGRTTFAIAHRLSTLRNADRLVVIEKGRVVETGTHDELLNKPGGVFRKLVTMQTEMNQIHYIGG